MKPNKIDRRIDRADRQLTRRQFLPALAAMGAAPLLSAPRAQAAQPDPAPAQPADRPGPRNPKLRDVPENTWVELCKYEMDAGASEVPWCYDPERKAFIRVGGCSNQYSNEIWSFNVGTERFTRLLPYTKESGLKRRPGHGCNRYVCYDADRQCIWTYGGATSYSPAGNTLGLWRGTGDLREGDWMHIEGLPSMGQGGVAYDPKAKKLICLGEYTRRTIVYDPETNKWHRAAANPYDQDPESRISIEEPYPGFFYVPDLEGCLMIAARPATDRRKQPVGEGNMEVWLFDASAEKWTNLESEGPFPSPRKKMGCSYDPKSRVILAYGGGPENARQLNDTWVYLIKENRWRQLEPKTSPPPGKEGMKLAYDPEHEVHVLGQPGGSVWAFRYR